MRVAYETVQAGALECALTDEEPPRSLVEVEGGPTCPSGMRNTAYKFAFELPTKRAGPGHRLGVQVDCEKIAIDLEFDLVAVDGGLAEFGLGGFGQVEMYRLPEPPKPRVRDPLGRLRVPRAFRIPLQETPPSLSLPPVSS
jgi:hypothetical protein